VIGGRAINPKRVKRDEMPSLLQVGEWTEQIFSAAPKTSDVRGRLAQHAIEDSLRLLLHRFHGRETELARLRKFVGRSSTTGPAQIFGISGIGGSGKSTLLARFIDAQLKNPVHRRGIVLIDFDRARFWSGDPIALTFELTRQIAAWFPELSEPLTELRNNVRRNLVSSGFVDVNQAATSGTEAIVRATKEVNHLLGGILKHGRIGGRGMRPLIVILDTFELLQGTRGDSAQGGGVRGVEAVLAWADELVATAGLDQLKVIVAGRAPIAEDPTFGPRIDAEREIRLTGLDKDASKAVLRDHGVSAADTSIIIDAVNDADGLCNPLILRLAARLVQSRTIRASALKDDKKQSRTVLDQELIQGVLYRRILEHIGDRQKDETLAAVAHPGLVLRRVTPELIEAVLFKAIRMKVPAPTATARDLFNRLRKEVWLVQDAGTDAVTHRLDLRQTMLRLIDADRRDTARKIHRAAIKYYESGRDPHLSAEMAAGEAYYHRLMLMAPADAARIKPADVRRFESSLFPTLGDLPRHVSAVVNSILDRPLSDEEGASLPEPHRKDFVLRHGERHLLNDDPYRALKLLEAEPDLHPAWELRALALTVQWDLARKRGLLSRTTQGNAWALMDKYEAGSSVSGDLVNDTLEPLNLVAWIWFCLKEPKQALAVSMQVLSSFYRQGDWAKLPPRTLESVARTMTYRTVCARDAGDATRVEQPIPWSRLSSDQLGTTTVALEATRHAVLSAAEHDAWDPVVVLSGENIPPSFRLLKAIRGSRPPVSVSSRLRPLEKSLRGLTHAPSGHILGTIARAFTRTVVVRPSEWADGARGWDALCGCPEFRGPAKFALLDAFTTKKDFEQMAGAAWDLMDLRPTDFRPDAFAEAAARPHRAGLEIANLVLYMDRITALGQFLERMNDLKPKRTKLTQVTAAFERWDHAFMPHMAPPVPARRKAAPSARARQR